MSNARLVSKVGYWGNGGYRSEGERRIARFLLKQMDILFSITPLVVAVKDGPSNVRDRRIASEGGQGAEWNSERLKEPIAGLNKFSIKWVSIIFLKLHPLG